MSFQVGDVVVRNENNLFGFWARRVGPSRLRGEFIVSEAGRHPNEIKLEGVTTDCGRSIGFAADCFTLVRSPLRLRVGDVVIRKENFRNDPGWKRVIPERDLGLEYTVSRITRRTGDSPNNSQLLWLEGVRAGSFHGEFFRKVI